MTSPRSIDKLSSCLEPGRVYGCRRSHLGLRPECSELQIRADRLDHLATWWPPIRLRAGSRVPAPFRSRGSSGGVALRPTTSADLVRPPGFEPGTCGLRVRCSAVELEAPVLQPSPRRSTGCACIPGGVRVTDGARTRDLRGHIPALCQLSYGHQGASSVAQTGVGPDSRSDLHGLAPVAQLDRAGGFYPSGCAFKSCRGRRRPCSWARWARTGQPCRSAV